MIRLLKLEKSSPGVEDRFACQAKAQRRALIIAAQQGVEIIPVWNRSNRERLTAGSEPAGTRAAAAAVKETGWGKPCRIREKYHPRRSRATHQTAVHQPDKNA